MAQTIGLLKFTPLYMERIWGGTRLCLFRNDVPQGKRIGESWDIAGFDQYDSIIERGSLEGNSLTELIEIYMGDLVGDRVYAKYGTKFPLLVKWLDAGMDLSIQVHPDDEMAMRKYGTNGKSEFWFIAEAETSARIVNGVRGGKLDKGKFKTLLADNQFGNILTTITPREREAYYIPAGHIHSLGKGTLVLEIQQASDVTYRIYDYDRVGDDGQKRVLHTQEALEAINFEEQQCLRQKYPKMINQVNEMIASPYYTVNYLQIDGSVIRDYYPLDSFVLLTQVGGDSRVSAMGVHWDLHKGETWLVPACMSEIQIESVGNKRCELIETYVS